MQTASRTIEVLFPPSGSESGVIQIRDGNQTDKYFITSVVSEWGPTFRLEKIGGSEVYEVIIDAGRGSCECKGFGYRGKCRHISGIRALLSRGKI